jgi:hypothetical protein
MQTEIVLQWKKDVIKILLPKKIARNMTTAE